MCGVGDAGGDWVVWSGVVVVVVVGVVVGLLWGRKLSGLGHRGCCAVGSISWEARVVGVSS